MKHDASETNLARPGTRSLYWISLIFLLAHTATFLLFLLNKNSGTDSALRGVPLDDTWIHFVYARNLARYGAFYYNPGQLETGFTSPLWIVILAVPARLGLDPVLSSKIIGLCLGVLVSVVAFRICQHLSDTPAGIIAGLAIALDPYHSLAKAAGLEVALLGFLSTAALYFFLRDRLRLAAIFVGLSIVTRPEAAVLLGILLTVLVIDNMSGFSRMAAKKLANFSAVSLIPPALWMLYCLLVSGKPLPSTFYVKARFHGFVDPGQLNVIGTFLWKQPFFESFVGLLLCFTGLASLARTKRVKSMVLIYFPVAYLYGLSVVADLGRLRAADQPGSVLNIYFARYMIPALPFILIVISLGLTEAARGVERLVHKLSPAAKDQVVRRANRRTTSRALAYLAVVGLLIVPSIKMLTWNRTLAGIYSLNTKNVQDMQVALGKWIDKKLPEDAVVGVNDAGALRYFGNRTIIDLTGLNSFRVIGTDPNSIAADYYIIFPGWLPGLKISRGLRELYKVEIEKNTICFQREMVVLETPKRPSTGGRGG